MGRATKEVMDILERVYKCPGCMILSPEERQRALAEIMTTYARNRSEILREANEIETEPKWFRNKRTGA